MEKQLMMSLLFEQHMMHMKMNQLLAQMEQWLTSLPNAIIYIYICHMQLRCLTILKYVVSCAHIYTHIYVCVPRPHTPLRQQCATGAQQHLGTENCFDAPNPPWGALRLTSINQLHTLVYFVG